MVKNRNVISWPSWVRHDDDLIRFIHRIANRNKRYPNWRQVYYECMGICQYPIIDTVCGATESLEFHEVYKENGQVFCIVLLCNYHHFSVHQGIVNPRRFPSMLQIDIDIEMKLAGGLIEWKKKFNIIEKETDYDFKMDTGKNKDDFQPSENSQDNGC